MKKIIIICLLCILSTFANSANLRIHLEAFDKNSKEDYALCLSDYSWKWETWHENKSIQFSKDGNFDLDLKTGRYILTMLHPSSETVHYHVWVKNTTDKMEMNIKMAQLYIPADFNKVCISGDFIDNRNDLAIPMVFDKKQNAWVLNDSLLNVQIKDFIFVVDGKAVHSNQLKLKGYDKWASLLNLNEKGNKNIKFHKEEYKLGIDEPSINLKGIDEDYNQLCTKLNSYYYPLKWMQINYDDTVTYKQTFAEFSHNIDSLKIIYGKKYDWIFMQAEMVMNGDLHPTYFKLYQTYKTGDSQKQQELQKSDEYYNYISNLAKIALNFSQHSPVIGIIDASTLISLDYRVQSYDLFDELNISSGYFQNIISEYVKNHDEDEVCGFMLFDRINDLARIYPKKCEPLLQELKEKYPTYSGITNGRVEKLIAAMAIQKGAIAPNFSLKTLSGEEFKLSDQKGKYVFIDFWGTWCAPCRGEIPNIIELRKNIPAEKLTILGISCNDTEEKLKTFISENKINYTNALADDKVQEMYGISSYPTTILLDPNGKIISKNLRGSDLSKMVENLMN